MEPQFLIENIYPLILAAAAVAIPLVASYHIISTKTDVRAAIGWTGLVWMVPFIGTALYLAFGINRIRRKAARRRREKGLAAQARKRLTDTEMSTSVVAGEPDDRVAAQNRLMDRVTGLPLTKGNRIDCFDTGEAAFTDMLAAIDAAKASVALATYIFDYDAAGKRFVGALKSARERGVEVRVLIDGVGELYHYPSSWRMLRRAGVTVQRFNRSALPWRVAYMNLRNHRKILVVDGSIGFTGGMNIREGNMANGGQRPSIRDAHFRLVGPVVWQLMEVFAEDWVFAAGEQLDGSAWFPEGLADQRPGRALARGIPDGPDEDLNKISWGILSALGMARRSVRILTPYFLPNPVIVSALNQAALRGVQVDILLPERSNLRIVQWASRAQYGQVLASGCRIHHVPPPFDHTKLMIVDEHWSLFGSSNWDARSLRLNFEFNVECYDEELAARLTALVDRRITEASPVDLKGMAAVPFLARLRNGVAWLFSPYL